MRAIFILALKDLKLLSRDLFGLFWVIGFPLILALFFGSIFGSGGTQAKSMKVAYSETGFPTDTSDFYNELSKIEVLNLIPMAPDSAYEAVARGKLTAYVNYIDTTEAERFSPGLSGSIRVGIDPSRQAEQGYLRGLITEAYFKIMKKSFSDISGMKASLDKEISAIEYDSSLADDDKVVLNDMLDSFSRFLSGVNKVDSTYAGNFGSENYSPFKDPDIKFEKVSVSQAHPRTSYEITFPQALQWALIGCVSAFALGIVIERTRGTYIRLRLAPISKTHILAGKGLACFIACELVCVVLLILGVVIFNIRIAYPAGLAMALLASGICFTGLMMFTSVIGDTEQAVGGAGWAIFIVLAMTGGAMVPLFVMPPWMAAIGSISPVKWSILAFEGVIWRGFDFAELLTPLLILTGGGVALFSAGAVILSREDS